MHRGLHRLEVRHCLDSLGLLTNYSGSFMPTRTCSSLKASFSNHIHNCKPLTGSCAFGIRVHWEYATSVLRLKGEDWSSVLPLLQSSRLALAGFPISCICNGRFGKLFRGQEASGWDLEAVDFVCLLPCGFRTFKGSWSSVVWASAPSTVISEHHQTSTPSC